MWLDAGRPTVVKGREVWLLKLRGVDGPEAAEQLNGLFLLGDPASRPALVTDDEFYVQVRLHRLEDMCVLRTGSHLLQHDVSTSFVNDVGHVASLQPAVTVGALALKLLACSMHGPLACFT